jgi:hypothetical protein
MSYDIYFVRRDPGQSFEDALDELESAFPDGDPADLTEDELDWWAELVPQAGEILGEIEVAEDGDVGRELTATGSGIELTMLSGEVTIHVPDPAGDVDEVALMSTVYELARAVEDVTGLEGYDPQLGEPVSDQLEPRLARDLADSPADDDDDLPTRSTTSPAEPIGDPRPDMAPDPNRPRRWWEFWRA